MHTKSPTIFFKLSPFPAGISSDVRLKIWECTYVLRQHLLQHKMLCWWHQLALKKQDLQIYSRMIKRARSVVFLGELTFTFADKTKLQFTVFLFLLPLHQTKSLANMEIPKSNNHLTVSHACSCKALISPNIKLVLKQEQWDLCSCLISFFLSIWKRPVIATVTINYSEDFSVVFSYIVSQTIQTCLCKVTFLNSCYTEANPKRIIAKLAIWKLPGS